MTMMMMMMTITMTLRLKMIRLVFALVGGLILGLISLNTPLWAKNGSSPDSSSSPFSTSSSSSSSALGIEQSIANKIQPALQLVDPLALVSVQVAFRKIQKRLPMTTFTIKNLALKADDGTLEVSNIHIKIFVSDPKYGESFKGLAAQLLENLPVTPQFSVQSVPADWAAAYGARQKSESETHRDPASDHSEPGSTLSSQRLWMIFAVGFGTLLVLVIGAQVLTSRRGLKVLQDLEGAVAKASSRHAEGSDLPTTAPSSATPVANELSSVAKPSAHSLDGLSDESMSALFMDAYWSSEDGYAAWIWHAISGPRQRILASVLASGVSQGAEYLRHIADVSPQDLGYQYDPAYLDPLPIAHLNQGELDKQIQKNPGLYLLLPKMRKERLSLFIGKRLELEKSVTLPPNQAREILLAATPSPFRKIVSETFLPIQNVEEENELLVQGKLTIEMAKRLPSLLVCTLLEDTELQSILEKFSSVELARAWIGPASVLNQLKSRLPGPKAELLNSYLQNEKAVRMGTSFQKLRNAAFNQLAQRAVIAAAPPGAKRSA